MAFVFSLFLLSGCGAEDDAPPGLLVHSTLRPPNQDVYLVDGPEAEPRRVTDHPALDYNATFSSDGRWLVFTSDRGGSPDLYALDLEEGGEPGIDMHPASCLTASGSPSSPTAAAWPTGFS